MGVTTDKCSFGSSAGSFVFDEKKVQLHSLGVDITAWIFRFARIVEEKTRESRIPFSRCTSSITHSNCGVVPSRSWYSSWRSRIKGRKERCNRRVIFLLFFRFWTPKGFNVLELELAKLIFTQRTIPFCYLDITWSRDY